jgi:ADP-heptose:LPS heptosyltransferase
MKILIYNSGGGLGDSIQLFDLMSSLSNKFESKNIYYLSSHVNHFNNALRDYNIHLNELKMNILYFGFRWWHLLVSKKKILKENSIDEFDLIIDLQSKLRNTLILKNFPHKNFYSSTFNFRFCNIKKKYISSKYEIKNILKNIEELLNIEIPYKKYDLNLIDKKFFDEAKKFLPSKDYIGFSITQGNKYRKKSWALDKFINLAKKVANRNKKIVFFIDKNETEIISKIKNEVNFAIFPESMSSLSGPPLVSALSKRLDKAISIDNGIMHMMGLADIPMIVLFGPTNSKKFAPKIKDINILDSKIIYNSNDIQKITENDVLRLL